MDLDFIADKVHYHTSITQPTKKIDVMLQRMGYAKAEQSPAQHRSLRQIDMLNYYTEIKQPSLAERIIEKYKK
jgi:hypothetical protein